MAMSSDAREMEMEEGDIRERTGGGEWPSKSGRCTDTSQFLYHGVGHALSLLVIALLLLNCGGGEGEEGTTSQKASLSAVRKFYSAVDTKDLAAIGAATTDDFEAIFGAGCAGVGGATQCGEATYKLAAFKSFIAKSPPKKAGGMARILAPHGDTVLNHYQKKDAAGAVVGHGAVVFRVQGGKVLLLLLVVMVVALLLIAFADRLSG